MGDNENPSPPPSRKLKKRRFGLSSVIMGLFAVPLLVMAANLGRGWKQLDSRLAAIEAEQSRLIRRNAVLARAHEATQLQRFQVCNKTAADTVIVDGVAALYHDGKRFILFDSARCSSWRAVELGPGDARFVTLSSPQEGCNWNGAVVLQAMHLTRESDEQVSTYDIAGPWRGFDRDCFTVQ